MLVVRLLVNSRPLVKFWGSQELYINLVQKVGAPSPHVVQESTVYIKPLGPHSHRHSNNKQFILIWEAQYLVKFRQDGLDEGGNPGHSKESCAHRCSKGFMSFGEGGGEKMPPKKKDAPYQRGPTESMWTQQTVGIDKSKS